jgi:hypothetical protein
VSGVFVVGKHRKNDFLVCIIAVFFDFVNQFFEHGGGSFCDLIFIFSAPYSAIIPIVNVFIKRIALAKF